MAKRILVADDNGDIVKVLASRLKANNYEVVEVYDGVHALQEVFSRKPDLIVLDVRMPAGDGITVGEILKLSDKTASIPVIIITAYPSDEVRKKTKEIGVKYFITKPFDAEDLLAKIKDVLGE